MIREGIDALQRVGYDTKLIFIVIRADLPRGYAGMTLGTEGVVLGADAFSSQAMLDHVLEEELLHLLQKASGKGVVFDRMSAATLEEEVHAKRKFQRPSDVR